MARRSLRSDTDRSTSPLESETLPAQGDSSSDRSTSSTRSSSASDVLVPSDQRALSACRTDAVPAFAWSILEEHPVPVPEETQLLVKTNWVGLNPVDWQGVEYKFAIGNEHKVMGRDGAGVVVGVGSSVERFRVGDRVFYCSNPGSSSASAFQHYSVHDEAEVGLVPATVTDAEAATLGTGLVTAAVALFKTLGLELCSLDKPQVVEEEQKPWLLVWGGAGITGIYLIQLAKLAGFRVVCAASPINAPYIKSLGADVILNRWDAPEVVVEGIRKATGDEVALAVDNVGKETAALCEQVLAGSKSWREANNIETPKTSPKAKLVAIAGSPAPRSADVLSDGARSVEQLRISFSTTFYGHPDFSTALLSKVSSLLSTGALKPARTHVLAGGLGGIVAGLANLKRGSVPGGHKLVCKIDDEPLVDQVVIVQEQEEQLLIKAEAELGQSLGKRSLAEVDLEGAKRVKSAA